MRHDFLKTLHCPYTGSRFVTRQVSGDTACVKYGIAASEAGDFPIVDGILRLTVDDYRAPLVDLINANQPEKAWLTALDAPIRGRFGRAVNLIERASYRLRLTTLASALRPLKRSLYRVLSDGDATLAASLNALALPSTAWHMQRFSMPRFLPIYPLLHFVKPGAHVLDFGCGMGHAAFLMSRRTNGSQITCADVQFHLLFLARKLFLPDGNFICINGDYPLPFESRYFSMVACSDALHFVESKLNLGQEFRRVLSDDGTIVLPHLHNKLSAARWGTALTPRGYGALFEGIEQRMVPEEWMVEQFVEADSLDLTRRWTDDALQESLTGVSLIASRNSSTFVCHRQLWPRHIDGMKTPIINPVYRCRNRNGAFELTKRRPDSGQTVPGDNPYLPDTISLPLASLETKSLLSFKLANPTMFNELARHFVVIDAPERFQ